MRRTFAAVLVLVFSLPLITPALAPAPDDSQLPACCRRSGEHHCAMSMDVNAPSRCHVVREICPFSPFAHTPLVQPHAFAMLDRPVLAGFASSPAEVVGSAEAGYRISADRARHKRGPPDSLAL
jgi:hypothetical protein